VAKQGKRRRRLTGALYLSAVEVSCASPEFSGTLVPYDDEVFKALKARDDLFAYRNRSLPAERQILVIPLLDDVQLEGASFELIPIADYPLAIARLVEYRLPDLLPKLQLRRTRWGLERIRREDDLVSAAFRRINQKRPSKTAGMHRFHRTVFRVRHEQVAGDGALIMTIEFRRRQEVTPPVADLVAQGFDLSGLDVFQQLEDAPRKWLGRVGHIDGSNIVLRNEQSEVVVDGKDQYVESSSDTFAALFTQALGQAGYDRLRQAEWAIRAEEVCGQGYVNRLQNVSEYLTKGGQLQVAPSIAIRFGRVVPLSTTGASPSAVQLPAVEYCFSWDRTAIDKYPSSGLDKHGPFDDTTFDTKEPNLLVVCPADTRNDVDHFIRRLRDGMAKDGPNQNTRFSRGLVGTYRLTKLATRFLSVDTRGAHSDIGTRYVDALKEHLGSQRAPDIVLVVIHDRHAFLTRGTTVPASVTETAYSLE
jgi:hypothetical protein